MQIAFYCAHHNYCGGFCCFFPFNQQRFQYSHSCFHGTCCQQNFRNENTIVLEVFTNNFHSCNQAFFQHFHCSSTFGQCIFSHFLYWLVLPFKQQLVHQRIIRHSHFTTSTFVNSGNTTSFSKQVRRNKSLISLCSFASTGSTS